MYAEATFPVLNCRGNRKSSRGAGISISKGMGLHEFLLYNWVAALCSCLFWDMSVASSTILGSAEISDVHNFIKARPLTHPPSPLNTKFPARHLRAPLHNHHPTYPILPYRTWSQQTSPTPMNMNVNVSQTSKKTKNFSSPLPPPSNPRNTY